jgi:hypothetical protein
MAAAFTKKIGTVEIATIAVTATDEVAAMIAEAEIGIPPATGVTNFQIHAMAAEAIEVEPM